MIEATITTNVIKERIPEDNLFRKYDTTPTKIKTNFTDQNAFTNKCAQKNILLTISPISQKEI